MQNGQTDLQKVLEQTKPQFLCERGGLHKAQYLDFICMDDQCRNKYELFCSICLQENINNHNSHNYLVIRSLLSNVIDNLKEENIPQKLTKEEIKKSVDYLLETKKAFEELAQKCSLLAESLNEQLQSQMDYSQILSKYNSYVSQVLKQKESKAFQASLKNLLEKFNYNKLSRNCVPKLQREPLVKVSQFANKINNFQEDIDNLLKECSLLRVSDMKIHQFNKENIFSDLKIINGSKVSTVNYPSQKFVMALLEKQISTKKCSYTFNKIKSDEYVIGFGIADYQKVKKTNFQIQNKHSLGHGMYVFGSGDSTFNSFDETYNNQRKGISIDDGHRVRIDFDLDTRTLTAVNLDNNETSSMKFQVYPDSVFYPVIYFNGMEVQEAEILQE